MGSSKKHFSAIGKALEDIPELREILESYARLLKVGMGVLRDGREVEALWPFNFSNFCQLVRSSAEGRTACTTSDRERCKECRVKPHRRTEEDFLRCRCHMGLIDLSTPIVMRGYVFAHLFAGQVRTINELRNGQLTKARTTALRRRHAELHLDRAGVSFDKFLHAYEDLPMFPLEELRRVDAELRKLADLIGVIAESVHTLLSLSELTSDLIPIRDMEMGLRVIYRTVARLLNADSGSVWLAHRENCPSPAFGYATELQPLIIDWFSDEENQRLAADSRLAIGEGLAGWIAQRRQVKRCCSAKEVSNISAKDTDARKRRRLRSMIGTPIMSQGSLLGVFELGSKRECWFNQVDEQLVEAVGRIAANFVRRVRERNLVLEMHGLQDEDQVFRFLETQLPPLFGSLAASVFKPERRDGATVLVPTVADTVVKGLGPGSTENADNSCYRLGEGLTGWVGKYLLCLRIERCDREKDILAAFQRALQSNGGWLNGPVEPPIWQGKTRAATEAGARRGRNGPIMICPVVDSHKRLRAVVRVCEHESKQFSEADENFLKDICEQAAICLGDLSQRRDSAQRDMAAAITQYTHDFGRDVRAAREYVLQALRSANQPGKAVEVINSLEKTICAIGDLDHSLSDIMTRGLNHEPSRSGRISRFSVVAVITDLIEARKEVFQNARIALTCNFDVPNEDACVSADRDLFLRCVANILTNSSCAIGKVGKDRGEIVVTVTQVTHAANIGVTFVDSGPGFDEDVLRLIQERRAISADKCFGNGVALQYCRYFVEDILGGGFEVSNERDGGACVEWTIPVETIGVKNERSHAERPI